MCQDIILFSTIIDRYQQSVIKFRYGKRFYDYTGIR